MSMNDHASVAVTVLTAIGCGLNGGIFFAFSAFVMPGLDRLEPVQGNEAMQAINVAAVTPPFMASLFGTALGCIALAISSLLWWPGPGNGWIIGGCLLYLAGTIGVTIVFNVPRNNRLAASPPDTAEGTTGWDGYVSSWTRWNSVRAIAGATAAAALTVGLVIGRAGTAR
jgi:uncharacterized membrane protein